MIQPIVCPVCGKISGELAEGTKSATPFCSDRCRKIDFFRWFDGRHQIVEELTLESSGFGAEHELKDDEGTELDSYV